MKVSEQSQQTFTFPAQPETVEEEEKHNPQSESLLSRLFFCQALKTMKLAQDNQLKPENIELRQETSYSLFQRFIVVYEGMLNGKHKLARALCWSLKWELIQVFAILLVATLSQLAIPLLIRQIIEYISGEHSLIVGAELIACILLARFLNVLCTSHSRSMIRIAGNDAMTIVSLQLLNKTMKVSFYSNKEHSQGQVLNLMQVDAQKLILATQQLSGVALTPIQLLIAIYLMFELIGVSFTAGLAIIVITAVVNVYLGSMLVKNQNALMKDKDARTKQSNEIFSQIKFIKINALEDYFKEKLFKLRDKEVQTLSQRLKASAYGILSVWLSPQLILASTFGVYVYMGNTLTPGATFATISLFQTLQQPLLQLPMAINALIETNISLQRIQKYLQTGELQDEIIKQTEDHAITVKHGNFYWQDDTQILFDINMIIQKGQFVAIIGDAGSGKSSFLQAILGEMLHKTPEPEITINGTFAYVSQKIWIQNATVKDNILFGMPYEKRRYDEAIRYSSLIDDLSILIKGDQTMIGEKGVNLSGGQRARVSLARAIYSDAEIFLLDDPISAVDVHVGKYIMQKCLNGYLKNKTRVLITHAINFCQFTDYVYILDKGQVIEQGNFEQVKASDAFQQISKKYFQQQDQPLLDQYESLSLSLQSPMTKAVMTRKETMHDEIDDLMTLEDRTQGDISMAIINQYMQYNGGSGVFIFVGFIMLAWITCYLGSSLWIAYWTNQNDQFENKNFYILIYVLFGVGQGLFAFARGWTIIGQSVKAASSIHNNMIECLLRAPQCQFFERVPQGRIMNRFTKDQNVLDAEIYWNVSWLYTKFGQLISNTLLNVYASTLYILIPIVIYFYSSLRVQRLYMAASRELYRFDLTTRSPILSYFSEVVSGLPVIRAFNKQDQMFYIFSGKQDLNRKIIYEQNETTAWFLQVLGLSSFIVNLSAILYCIMSSTNPAFAGLLMTYASQLDQNISQTVESLGLLENGIISFERCLAYTQIKSEPGYNKGKSIEMWPKKGDIVYKDFSAHYRDNLPAALSRLSITISHGTKLGVVGRTGAGKSTITLTLLRILEAMKGQILIDGVDISTLSLKQLRESITMIQQDATIFDGTIRENIDPLQLRSDDEIMSALIQCCLKPLVDARQGLDTKISEGGDNLSAGEKQLVCIARAVLKKSPIVLIDEATANIDIDTENTIQDTIERAFKNCTVITIAHRINTILHCDKILVIDKGELKEFGVTQELLQQKDSVFYGIYKESQKYQKK